MEIGVIFVDYIFLNWSHANLFKSSFLLFIESFIEFFTSRPCTSFTVFGIVVWMPSLKSLLAFLSDYFTRWTLEHFTTALFLKWSSPIVKFIISFLVMLNAIKFCLNKIIWGWIFPSFLAQIFFHSLSFVEFILKLIFLA